MSRLVIISVSAILMLLPAFMFWDGATTSAMESSVVVQKTKKLKKFPHRKHVHKDWLKNEVARDCRGCHDYDDAGGVMEPEQACVLCHSDFPNGEKSLTVEGSIQGMRKEGSSFIHGDHNNLKCNECHAPPAKSGGVPGVPNQMYIPEGLGWCVKCHDPSAPNAPSSRSKDDIGFQKAINANPRMNANPDAVFLHTQHLTASELKDPKNCAACHSSLSTADANIGENVYNSASCGDCHQSAAGKKLPFGTKPRTYVSGSDLSFYHSDHISSKALSSSKRLRTEGCFACHDLGQEEGRGISDYPLKRGYDKFEQCAKCHEEEKVEFHGLKHDQEALPIEWRLEDHADISDKNSCSGCHVFGEAVSMKTTRPERTLDRSRPSLFEITVQAHPHITGSNAQKTKECKSCHIAEADLIPSRIKKKKFRHESHLSKKSTNQDCLSCHLMGDSSLTSLMETSGHADLSLSYSEKSCTECHKGVDLIQAGEYTKKTPKSVVFAHSDHIKGKAASMKCSDCHTNDGSGDREFGFGKGVLNCSQCHDHSPEHMKETGNKGLGYTNSCVACHEVHVPGIPKTDSTLEASRVDIYSIDGAQFHPVPSEKKCSECHRPGFTMANLNQSKLSLVMSDRANYKQESGRGNGFHGKHEALGQPTSKACFTCHWNDFGVLPTTVTTAKKDGQLIDISGQPYSNPRVDSKIIRNALGSHVQGFPGTKTK
ncbi:MAG: hypothetical protein ACI97A_004098 [Planctomycetota bacterium]|jgi:hypothetical protein